MEIEMRASAFRKPSHRLSFARIFSQALHRVWVAIIPAFKAGDLAE
jgi:hypothetical protein